MKEHPQRAEHRVQTFMPAQIEAVFGRCLGTVLDLSPSGGRLKTNRRIEVGSEITVRLTNDIERIGTVRRCEPDATSKKFDIGFELMGERWPEHLTEEE